MVLAKARWAARSSAVAASNTSIRTKRRGGFATRLAARRPKRIPSHGKKERGGWRRSSAAVSATRSSLGGHTIPALLVAAARAGIGVLVWFVGLSTPEQHLERVRARVAAGGHDIPEEMIRRRWDSSRRNVIALMPHLTDLRVFDNSEEGNPAAGTIPEPQLLLHWRLGRVVAPSAEELRATPDWAKAIVAAALKLQRSGV